MNYDDLSREMVDDERVSSSFNEKLYFMIIAASWLIGKSNTSNSMESKLLSWAILISLFGLTLLFLKRSLNKTHLRRVLNKEVDRQEMLIDEKYDALPADKQKDAFDKFSCLPEEVKSELQVEFDKDLSVSFSDTWQGNISHAIDITGLIGISLLASSLFLIVGCFKSFALV